MSKFESTFNTLLLFLIVLICTQSTILEHSDGQTLTQINSIIGEKFVQTKGKSPILPPETLTPPPLVVDKDTSVIPNLDV